jgi:hypothetical protein
MPLTPPVSITVPASATSTASTVRRDPEGAIDERREDDEEAGNEAGAAGARRLHADGLEEVAGGEDGAGTQPDQKLTTRGQAVDDDCQDRERKQETDLEKRQRRIL